MSKEQMLKDLELSLISIQYDFGSRQSSQTQALSTSEGQKQLIAQWELALKGWLDTKAPSAWHLYRDGTLAPQYAASDFKTLEEKFELTLSWAAHHNLAALVHALVRYCLPALTQIKTNAELPLPELKLSAGAHTGQPLWAWVIQHDYVTIFKGLVGQCDLKNRMKQGTRETVLGLYLLRSQAPKILDYVLSEHLDLLIRKEDKPRDVRDEYDYINFLDFAIVSLQVGSEFPMPDKNFEKIMPLMLEHPHLGYPIIAENKDNHYIKHLLDNPEPRFVGSALSRALLLYESLSEEKRPELRDMVEQLLALVQKPSYDYPYAPLTKFLESHLGAIVKIDREARIQGVPPLDLLAKILLITNSYNHSDDHATSVISKLLLEKDYVKDMGHQPRYNYSYYRLEKANLSFFKHCILTFIVFATELRSNKQSYVLGKGKRLEIEPFAEHIESLLVEKKPDEIKILLQGLPKTSLAQDVKQNLLCFVIQAGFDDWLEPLLDILGPNVATPAWQGLYGGILPQNLKWASRRPEPHVLNCYSRFKKAQKSEKIAERIKAQAAVSTGLRLELAHVNLERVSSRLDHSPSSDADLDQMSSDLIELSPLVRRKRPSLKNA